MSTLLQDARRYVEKGWKLVPLYGVKQVDGKWQCTCRYGPDCKSAGKHPRLNEWKKHTAETVKQVENWLDRWDGPTNIGILLGPGSGVIDIEFDSEEGRETAERLLSHVQTPTYISSRSVHRLFLWSAELPDIQKIEVAGLEIRIGGGGQSTQSVLPPSIHSFGEPYRWMEGFGPDLDPQPLPDSLFDHVYSHLMKQSFKWDTPSLVDELDGGRSIAVGERNNTLHRGACGIARRLGPEREDEIHRHTARWNLQCQEPLGEVEVRTLTDSAIRYIRSAPDPRPIRNIDVDVGNGDATTLRIADVPEPQQAIQQEVIGQLTNNTDSHHNSYYVSIGLSKTAFWWSPGEWYMTLVTGDPLHYHLFIPRIKKLIKTDTEYIRLEVDDVMSASKVAQQVLKQTGNVVLNANQRLWSSIWSGNGTGRYAPRGPGLMIQLISTCQVVEPDMTEKSFLRAAEYMLMRITDAQKNEPRDEPSEQTATHMGEHGDVWLRWQTFWQDGILAGFFNKDDIRRLKNAVEIGKGNIQRWPDHPRPGQVRLQYFVIKTAHIRRLQDLVLAIGGG